MDKEELIKSSACGSASRNFSRILQHCENVFFHTLAHYLCEKTYRIFKFFMEILSPEPSSGKEDWKTRPVNV